MAAQRHFTMSVLGAVIAIRQYLDVHHDASADGAAIAIRRTDTDYSGADFRTALELHRSLPLELVFRSYHADLRECLAFLILRHRPWWIRAIPFGRERLASAIGRGEGEGRDELQSLRAARLFDDPVEDEVVQWWDRLSQTVRAELADQRLLQGRQAERLSIEYERARLAALGITKQPRWVSIDDNSIGFDIQSYAPGPVEPVNRLIEVKSSSREPPRIILTKGEWDAALRYGAAYIFHIWQISTKTLIEKTAQEIAHHIPIDQGDGSWLQVEIEVSCELSETRQGAGINV
jgi:hypothetical protein